jgi:ATP-dependent helicase/nuclease subunit A
MGLEEALNVEKHIMVSSPAGSGKTQKLAERYVALLSKGVDVENIVAITFTDKAAREMKERILTILRRDYPELYRKILPKVIRMRISTIHSFCASFLRRFTREAGLEPGFEVMDEDEALSLFNEVLTETLLGIARDTSHPLHFQLLEHTVTRGWENLKSDLRKLYKKRPISDKLELGDVKIGLEIKEILSIAKGISFSTRIDRLLDEISNIGDGESLTKPLLDLIDIAKGEKFLTKDINPRRGKTEEGDMKNRLLYGIIRRLAQVESLRILKSVLLPLYREVLKAYETRKRELGKVDFADLEKKTLEILENSELYPNVIQTLFIFERFTHHILVDEFQDTNFIQWRIITKLIEEWRAGYGVKEDIGEKPSLFLVGDEKQSIYGFRGANVEVFQKARREIEEWFGDNFSYLIAEENYRSLDSIVDFVNKVFSSIMIRAEGDPLFKTSYEHFRKAREDEGKGRVELIVFEGGLRDVTRGKEADLIAKRILKMIEEDTVIEEGKPRRVQFKDIAILIWQRTHLSLLEDALRRWKIPFIVVKGTGFYDEPEIQALLSLVYFLADPSDDMSLFFVLRGPLGGLKDEELLPLCIEEKGFLIERVKKLKKYRVVEILEKAMEMRDLVPLSSKVEEILIETHFWSLLTDEQRRANVKKFLNILREMEMDTGVWKEIAGRLRVKSWKKDEAKALVQVENLDAVQILTIHAAKGLQFPVVFVTDLDRRIYERRPDENLFLIESEKIEEVKELYNPGYPISRLLSDDPVMKEVKERKVEEVKRQFYVALTRARDILVLTGGLKNGCPPKDSPMSWIGSALDIDFESKKCSVRVNGFYILDEGDIEEPSGKVGEEVHIPELVGVMVNDFPSPPSKFVDVTKLIDEKKEKKLRERYKRGREFGEAFHRVMYLVSIGELEPYREGILKEMKKILKKMILDRDLLEELVGIAGKHWDILVERGIVERIILGCDAVKRESEFPFYLRKNNILYIGRIDRILEYSDKIEIYDYKTFPVKDDEVDEVCDIYRTQMEFYKEAISKIFSEKDIRTFLVFTESGKIVEVKANHKNLTLPGF